MNNVISFDSHRRRVSSSDGLEESNQDSTGVFQEKRNQAAFLKSLESELSNAAPISQSLQDRMAKIRQAAKRLQESRVLLEG
jgi:hypothetical protein